MKAIILARVSSKDQEENNSIPAQTRRAKEYTARQNMDVLDIYPLTESSSKANRIKFSEIISQIKSAKETIALVVDTVDRLQRGFRESVLLDELRKSGKLELHFMRENLIIHQTSNSADILRWDMGVMFAKSYVTQLSDNVRRGQEEKLRNGEWLGKAPFGYKNITKDKKAWIQPDENAPIVVALYTRYASGATSMQKLRPWLLETYGVKMSQGQLYKVLKNPFYIGRMRLKGKLYPHVYKTIMSEELYDAVRKVASRYNKPAFKYAGLPYLYRGLFVCKDCGCRITPEQAKGYIYYHCTQHKGKHGASWFREEEITRQLQEAVTAIHPTREQYDAVMNALGLAEKDQAATKATLTTRFNTELAKINARTGRLFDVYMDGDIEKDEYKAKRNEYDHQKSRLEKRLLSLDEASSDWYKNAIAIMRLVRNLPQRFAESSEIEEKRRLLKILFRNLWIDGDKLGWEYQKPFDSMASHANHSLWRGVEAVFTESYDEFSVLASSIELFLESE
ncbi:MAG: recombinase family protein [Defluviitaleaceae bacterium]|nr:recombinase family protein [Defluviitaleaceae bacterium]